MDPNEVCLFNILDCNHDLLLKGFNHFYYNKID